jgi:hypothetical protein
MFTPVLAKHTKSFNLVDMVSVDVNRIQRNFEPLQRQVETWRKKQITDETAKLIFYSAFLDGKLEAPRSAARSAPAVSRTAVPEFAARAGGHYFPILTTWSTLFEDQFPSGSRITIEFTSA